MSQEEISLAASKDKESYDEVIKQNLQYPKLIAPILKAVVPEYHDCSYEEIIGYIVKDSINDDPVDDVSVVAAMQTEMSSISEKLVRYDSHFKAINPKLSNEEITIYLHFDLEVQSKYHTSSLGYPLVKRAIYYGAREISSQLGILTEQTNYDKLEKVYSIWICNDVLNKQLQNTVTSYKIAKSDEIGHTNEADKDYDLMNVIIIRRGLESSEEEIFDYLSKFFSSDIEGICKYVNIIDDEEIMEGVRKMPGMGQAIYDKGIYDGTQQGIQQGKLEQLMLLVKKGILATSVAASEASMSESDFSKLLEENK